MGVFYSVVNKKWSLSQFPHSGFLLIENVYNMSSVLVHTCSILYSLFRLPDLHYVHVGIYFIIHCIHSTLLSTASKTLTNFALPQIIQSFCSKWISREQWQTPSCFYFNRGLESFLGQENIDKNLKKKKKIVHAWKCDMVNHQDPR